MTRHGQPLPSIETNQIPAPNKRAQGSAVIANSVAVMPISACVPATQQAKTSADDRHQKSKQAVNPAKTPHATAVVVPESIKPHSIAREPRGRPWSDFGRRPRACGWRRAGRHPKSFTIPVIDGRRDRSRKRTWISSDLLTDPNLPYWSARLLACVSTLAINHAQSGIALI
jgi:hypothetical protein